MVHHGQVWVQDRFDPQINQFLFSGDKKISITLWIIQNDQWMSTRDSELGMRGGRDMSLTICTLQELQGTKHLGCNCARCGVAVIPLLENVRSEGTDESWIARSSFAILDMVGYWIEWCYQANTNIPYNQGTGARAPPSHHIAHQEIKETQTKPYMALKFMKFQ